MTESRGRHPFTVAAWILAGAVVVTTAVGVMGGILSPSLVVDLVAMWPLFAVILLWGTAGWIRSRRTQRRAGAILPLAIFTAVVLAVAVHIGGWEQLPSSEARLTGPPVSELGQSTMFTAQIVGDLQIMALADGLAYRVTPMLRGGQVGVPEAAETSIDGALSIRVTADEEAPSWYRFSGWKVGLAPETPWRLVVNGTIDADLSGLVVESAAMAGSGTVRLGVAPAGGANLVVAGEFRLVVPPDAPVEVSGDVEVPDDWRVTETGAASPEVGESGAAWSISVQGDTRVRVAEG